MIDSLHNVDVNFYRIFSGEYLDKPTFSFITHAGKEAKIPVYFARKSADGLVEAKAENYPTLSIQNYTPTVNQALFFDNQQKRYAKKLSVAGFVKVDEITDLFPLTFKYDVSIATKRESEWDAVKMAILSMFPPTKSGSLRFNQQDLGGEMIFDPVSYRVNSTDIPRSDGIFETNFEFTLFPFVQLVVPVEYDMAIVNVTIQKLHTVTLL